MSERVTVSQSGRVTTIALDRQDKRNAIDRKMRHELYAALEFVRDDQETWVAILTGKGGTFSTGHDLGESLEGSPSVGDLYALQHEIEKPLIAAISGACLAQGAGLALGCDIRLADDSAFFSWPQVKRGIGSISGPTLLARAVPVSVAMGYLLTGRRMSAKEASDLRLVTLSSGEDVHAAAQAVAAEIAGNAPLAVRAMKRAVLATQGLPAIEAYRVASEILAEVERSEDAREGMLAFLEKREPKWMGK